MTAAIQETNKPGFTFEENTPIAPPEQSPINGWGWIVCAVGFVFQFFASGQQSAAGILYAALMEKFNSERGETAWVCSLCASAVFVFAPFSTTVCHRYGCRVAMFMGGLLCIVGLVASSFCTSIPPLYFTYGLVVGLGMSVGYFATVLVIPEYFNARISLAYGIMTCGAAVGGIVLSPVMQLLFTTLGVPHTFRTLAAFYLLVVLCSFAFRPVRTNAEKVQVSKRRTFDWTVFHNKAYLVYVSSKSVFMLGYLVPYVHLVRMARDLGSEETKASFILVCVGVGSAIGRLAVGRVADFSCCNRLNICQLILLCLSVSATLVPLIRSYGMLASYASLYGFLEGSFVVINPVIMKDLVGKDKLSSALGACFFIVAFPQAVGPPIAGWAFDMSNSYDVAFFYMGAVTFLACLVLFGVRSLVERMNLKQDREPPLFTAESNGTALVRETRV